MAPTPILAPLFPYGFQSAETLSAMIRTAILQTQKDLYATFLPGTNDEFKLCFRRVNDESGCPRALQVTTVGFSLPSAALLRGKGCFAECMRELEDLAWNECRKMVIGPLLEPPYATKRNIGALLLKHGYTYDETSCLAERIVL